MPSGTKAGKEAKRRTVARGLVAGKGSDEIAAEAKCCRRHVQTLAAEAETQFLITEMMRPHRARLAELAKNAITAVGRALIAKNGTHADHTTRLRAVGRYRQLLEMAQGTKVAGADTEDGPMVTWEEFVVLYRSRQQPAEGEAPACESSD
jgi:hypothetical protein